LTFGQFTLVKFIFEVWSSYFWPIQDFVDKTKTFVGKTKIFVDKTKMFVDKAKIFFVYLELRSEG
jgi:hypothetical protein